VAPATFIGISKTINNVYALHHCHGYHSSVFDYLDQISQVLKWADVDSTSKQQQFNLASVTMIYLGGGSLLSLRFVFFQQFWPSPHRVLQLHFTKNK